jgi:hypothetical protein
VWVGVDLFVTRSSTVGAGGGETLCGCVDHARPVCCVPQTGGAMEGAALWHVHWQAKHLGIFWGCPASSETQGKLKLWMEVGLGVVFAVCLSAFHVLLPELGHSQPVKPFVSVGGVLCCRTCSCVHSSCAPRHKQQVQRQVQQCGGC